MNRFRLTSIRAQLVVWNILTIAVLMVILGVIAHFLVSSFMVRSVDMELMGRSDRFANMPRFRNGQQPGMRPDQNQPDGPPQERREHRNPFDAQGNELMPRQYDLNGKCVLPDSSRSLWDEPGFQAAVKGHLVVRTVSHDEEPIRVVSRPRREEGKIIGVIQVPYPLRDLRRAVAGLDRALLLLIPVGLLIAGMGGLLLTKRMLRPVRQLQETAQRMGADDLSQRITVSGHDEFADLASTFNGMLSRLESAFLRQQMLIDQQRRFTADASHELRTPLTVVKANTSLALTGNPTSEEYRQAVEEIDHASDAMNRLVGHLLFLAQADDDRLGLNAVELPVREVLDEAVRLSQKSNTATIKVEVADTDLAMKGNQDELVRLFVNLLDNAQRYTPADGSIVVHAERRDKVIVIAVTDTGQGIASEHVPHLGERFYRVDVSRSRQEGGSGLGLSICKSILAAHGGSMSIESVVDKGTTVTCRLPASDN